MPRQIVVKVIRPIVEVPGHEGEWRATDERGERETWFVPDEWMKECVGARPFCFFKALWSADGWIFKQPIRHHEFYW